VPTSILPASAIILDSGNGAFSANNPLATNYEYILITANNTGTNTVTFTRTYAGTTPKSYSAGATIAALLLAEDLGFIPQRFATQTPSSGTTVTQTIPSIFRHVDIIYDVALFSASSSIVMQLNGDTGAHYYWAHNDAASNGTRAGNGGEAVTSAEVGFVGTGGSQTYSGIIRLRDIQQTTRSIRWNFEGAYDANATPSFHDLRGSGLWFPVAFAAVTSIVLTMGSAITSSNFDYIGYP
jgi:hypothetical protein